MTSSAMQPRQTCVHCVALACLRQIDPTQKIALAAAMCIAWREGTLVACADCAACSVVAIPIPGRPDRPRLVPPRLVASRGIGSAEGRIALVHAVAHIEFNAINLACDAVYRFRELPAEFYADWILVAADEARHFSMLERRLTELGTHYGALDAHDGLWQMAVATAHDPLARMALVPRVLEARGLDVTPGMIERLRSVGDADTVTCLEIILSEEVAHVAAGTRWFRFLCGQRGLEADATFLALVREHSRGAVRGPFNLPHRRAAGFSEREMDELTRIG